MSSKIRLPHNGLALVSDGRKALVLRNEGDELYPNLKVDKVLEAPENPPAAQQGTDKPGRAFMLDQRGAVEQTDWHALAEQRFADEVAEAFEAICFESGVKAAIIAAPPRTLAELRSRFSEQMRKIILAEVNKDLTKHPVYEIEQHLIAT
ncbi:host attachment protein [Microvirga terricola]|uniref:Host attachment protein n=1 Tax=Microvirga terricola TaxID=2719797 RepID=A0ABX0V5D4_9HYPH|nr:host attachment family protein [Microvirga terricola]NIX75038.1 host attachment protein [Microvirga terricola]